MTGVSLHPDPSTHRLDSSQYPSTEQVGLNHILKRIARVGGAERF